MSLSEGFRSLVIKNDAQIMSWSNSISCFILSLMKVLLKLFEDSDQFWHFESQPACPSCPFYPASCL